MAEVAEPRIPDRRDFILQAAGAFVGVGGAVALWPCIDQMNPNNGTPPAGVTEVDLGLIQPGKTISVRWMGKPILVRNRTRDEGELAAQLL